MRIYMYTHTHTHTCSVRGDFLLFSIKALLRLFKGSIKDSFASLLRH